jgi:ribosomal protein S27AE
MSNFAEIRCPRCGADHAIDVEATIWVRFTSDGTDADAAGNRDHYYGDDSAAECGRCGYHGRLGNFPSVLKVEGGAP